MKKIIHHNKKVATSRTKDWQANLRKGKLDAMMNPSAMRLIRVRKGISQDDLAQKLEIAVSNVGAIERGHRSLSKDRAVKIAKILKVKTSELFITKDNLKFKVIF